MTQFDQQSCRPARGIRPVSWLVGALGVVLGSWAVAVGAIEEPCENGAFCQDGSCRIDCPNHEVFGPQVWCAPPRERWFAEADGVLLTRHVNQSARFAAILPSRTPVLTTHALDEPFRGAPRFWIGHRAPEAPWQVDFGCYWVSDWEASAAVRNDDLNFLGLGGRLVSPFSNFAQPLPVLGYDFNRLVSVREVSELQNYELNVRYQFARPGPPTALVAGVRYMGVQETFDYLSESLVPTPGGSSVSTSTRTANELWGPQIGLEVDFSKRPRWYVHCETKWAICNNHARQTTIGTLNTNGGATPLGGTAVTDATAWVGDLDVVLVWYARPHLKTRVGYQATWVGGLALGARNFAAPASVMELGPAAVDTSGTLFYHGPHVGLELAW